MTETSAGGYHHDRQFDRQKDHATLLRALATLKHLSWEVRLAGTGPLLEPAKMLASVLGIATRIRFLGECPDPPRLLADSQIFTLITNWEAFPISILEAMRSGLPVLATQTGGVSEAVEDGVTGFLVPSGDSVYLAQRLESLIGSANLRSRLGAQARTRYQQSFGVTPMLEKTLAIYAEAFSHKLTEEYPFVNPAQS